MALETECGEYDALKQLLCNIAVSVDTLALFAQAVEESTVELVVLADSANCVEIDSTPREDIQIDRANDAG